MSPYAGERAPGDDLTTVETSEQARWAFLVYTAGFALAIILTAISFWAANTSLLWPPGVPLGLAVLAIAQMGVHLVFFIHITTGADNTNNVLALAFGILIVVLVMVGSLWIMISLNANMAVPRSSGELMNLHMQH
jgi:cytochrome o ubiquinol oxidase subunit IV